MIGPSFPPPKKRRKVEQNVQDSVLHPRHPFKDSPPNFALLAKKYEDFASFVTIKKGRGHVNFRDAEAVRAVTKVLLKDMYGIDFDMPLHHLCPPVPQRLNYLLWVSDFLDSNQPDVRCLDIGTGASCIFPLLGYKHFKWTWVASEIIAESIESSNKNIERNSLTENIEVRKQISREHIFEGVIKPGEKFFATVCNPPFHSSLEQTGHNKKRALEAIASELVCPGGEVQFISTMISESLQFSEQVIWFSTMLGKKSSLKPLKRKLNDLPQKCHVFETEFQQGTQSRWGLMWTFQSEGSRFNKAEEKKITRKQVFIVENSSGAWSRFEKICKSYGLSFTANPMIYNLTGTEKDGNGFQFKCQGLCSGDTLAITMTFGGGNFDLFADLVTWIQSRLK